MTLPVCVSSLVSTTGDTESAGGDSVGTILVLLIPESIEVVDRSR